MSLIGRALLLLLLLHPTITICIVHHSKAITTTPESINQGSPAVSTSTLCLLSPSSLALSSVLQPTGLVTIYTADHSS